jgi:phosphatidylglycerophosphate synthase
MRHAGHPGAACALLSAVVASTLPSSGGPEGILLSTSTAARPARVSTTGNPSAPERPPLYPERAVDAVILATSDEATGSVVCGLSLRERARRVAVRAGASRVLVVDRPEQALRLPRWVDPARDLLVLCADGQVVHTPLVDAVRGPTSRPRVAVDPDNGAYAGALWAPAERALQVAAALAADPREGDAALARAWLADGDAEAAPHGPIARHPARTRAERRGATRMLFRLVDKAQDSPLARHVNRRVSYPITRLLLPTPVTPNMVSAVVLVVGVAGCALVARGGYASALAGALLVLLAGYLDGCDGEIARLRLESSRLGAWLDTIVDEATTILFLSAIGYHVYQVHGHPLLAWSIVLAVAAALACVYVIYYYLVVVAGSCNSQDYPTTRGGILEPLRVMVRRDVINLASVVLLAFGLSELVFAGMAAGSVVTAAVLIPQHLALRRALASGAVPRRGAPAQPFLRPVK